MIPITEQQIAQLNKKLQNARMLLAGSSAGSNSSEARQLIVEAQALIAEVHVTTNVNAATALRMLSTAVMSAFCDDDWSAFAGCETDNPMIGEIEDHTIVLDGDCLLVIANGDEGAGQQFKLTGEPVVNITHT